MTNIEAPVSVAPAVTRRNKRTPAGSRRIKGEQTRRRILDATLKVICHDGIRAVTHRSVAAEAGVHLSLTTYYFTDIEQMMLEAFQQFCEVDQPDLEAALESAYRYLDSFSARELRKRAVREEISNQMALLTGKHVYKQIIHNAERLALEQILFNESRLSPEVRKLGAILRQKRIDPLITLCRIFNRKDPEINAELLFGSIISIEYQALTTPKHEVDQDHITALLRRLMGWLAGLKSA
jgi:DNA-binding transcriptional regulator YbjK